MYSYSVCLTTQATQSGLILNFLGGFEGSADVLHLPNCGGDGQDLEATYPKKTKVHYNVSVCRGLQYVLSNLEMTVQLKKYCVFPGHKEGGCPVWCSEKCFSSMIPVIY